MEGRNLGTQTIDTKHTGAAPPPTGEDALTDRPRVLLPQQRDRELHELGFEDPTPGQTIARRIMAKVSETINQGTWPNQKWYEQAFADATHIAFKLGAVWVHIHRYCVLEDRLREEARKHPRDPAVVNRLPEVSHFGLRLESEEAIWQMKSCLDYLASFPRVVTPKWTLRTFGDGGEKVLKRLVGLDGNDGLSISATLIAELIKRHQNWIKPIIGIRDETSHYLTPVAAAIDFSVVAWADNTVTVPAINPDQTLREVLPHCWFNLFNFVEHFMLLTVFAKFPAGSYFRYAGSRDPANPESPVTITLPDVPVLEPIAGLVK